MSESIKDPDPIETDEWLSAINSVLDQDGVERAQYLLQRLSTRLTETGSQIPYSINTPYRNTIPVEKGCRAICLWRGVCAR